MASPSYRRRSRSPSTSAWTASRSRRRAALPSQRWASWAPAPRARPARPAWPHASPPAGARRSPGTSAAPPPSACGRPGPAGAPPADGKAGKPGGAADGADAGREAGAPARWVRAAGRARSPRTRHRARRPRRRPRPRPAAGRRSPRPACRGGAWRPGGLRACGVPPGRPPPAGRGRSQPARPGAAAAPATTAATACGSGGRRAARRRRPGAPADRRAAVPPARCGPPPPPARAGRRTTRPPQLRPPGAVRDVQQPRQRRHRVPGGVRRPAGRRRGLERQPIARRHPSARRGRRGASPTPPGAAPGRRRAAPPARPAAPDAARAPAPPPSPAKRARPPAARDAACARQVVEHGLPAAAPPAAPRHPARPARRAGWPAARAPGRARSAHGPARRRHPPGAAAGSMRRPAADGRLQQPAACPRPGGPRQAAAAASAAAWRPGSRARKRSGASRPTRPRGAGSATAGPGPAQTSAASCARPGQSPAMQAVTRAAACASVSASTSSRQGRGLAGRHAGQRPVGIDRRHQRRVGPGRHGLGQPRHVLRRRQPGRAEMCPQVGRSQRAAARPGPPAARRVAMPQGCRAPPPPRPAGTRPPPPGGCAASDSARAAPAAAGVSASPNSSASRCPRRGAQHGERVAQQPRCDGLLCGGLGQLGRSWSGSAEPLHRSGILAQGSARRRAGAVPVSTRRVGAKNYHCCAAKLVAVDDSGRVTIIQQVRSGGFQGGHHKISHPVVRASNRGGVWVEPDLELVAVRNDQSFKVWSHGYPFRTVRWHFHPEYELHLVTQTAGNRYVGDHIGAFGAGDLVLVGPNLPHNWISDVPGGEMVAERCLVLQFTSTFIAGCIATFPGIAVPAARAGRVASRHPVRCRRGPAGAAADARPAGRRGRTPDRAVHRDPRRHRPCRRRTPLASIGFQPDPPAYRPPP